jgi:MFS family permease
MDATEPVNLMKSVFVCNTFHFLYAASKACLFPFLTLYLRLLGLTATQTGIIIGGKTISAFVFAPLWAMISARFRKRRLVLMFSILMMATTYLGLTLIMNVNKAATSCNVEGPPGNITGRLQEMVKQTQISLD